MMVLICFAVCSCNNDTDGDGVENEKDKCPVVKAKTADGCPVEQQISAVHFYLETSASMGGYFKHDAQFPVIISDLTAKIDKNIRPIDIFFIAESTQKFNGTPQQFSSQIANTAIAPQKSSQLHNIIREIANKTDSNDISILVSDCILSFTDPEIKRNPEINKDNAQSTLRSNVFATFSDLNRKKGFGASIYAFRSKFYGTYYNYRNQPRPLAGDERPFYVWVIGNKELLAKFDAKLADISSFKPEQQLHFGLSDKPVTDYTIIPGIGRKGNWMQNGNGDGVEEIGDAGKTPAQICMALNLENLPPYAQDVAYLNQHLQLDLKGCTATVQVLQKKDADISKLRSEPQKAAFEKCTHVMMVQITGMALQDAQLTVRLPLRYDTWYEDWSCMNDLDLNKTCADRTFALEHLITGVREAFETKNENYIDLTLKLEK